MTKRKTREDSKEHERHPAKKRTRHTALKKERDVSSSEEEEEYDPFKDSSKEEEEYDAFNTPPPGFPKRYTADDVRNFVRMLSLMDFAQQSPSPNSEISANPLSPSVDDESDTATEYSHSPMFESPHKKTAGRFLRLVDFAEPPPSPNSAIRANPFSPSVDESGNKTEDYSPHVIGTTRKKIRATLQHHHPPPSHRTLDDKYDAIGTTRKKIGVTNHRPPPSPRTLDSYHAALIGDDNYDTTTPSSSSVDSLPPWVINQSAAIQNRHLQRLRKKS